VFIKGQGEMSRLKRTGPFDIPSRWGRGQSYVLQHTGSLIP